MFMLFNKSNDPRGINRDEFVDQCMNLLYISKQKAEEFFMKASDGQSHINFNNFKKVMKNS